MDIKFASNNEERQQVAKLSKAFTDEGICNGMIADDYEFFKSCDVVVAVENNKVVGYAYGDIIKEKNDHAYAKKHERVFNFEEMYILPEFRNKGIGKKLFTFLEDFAQENNCDLVELCAGSKDYERLLRFYTQELGMTFWNAFLYKRLHDWLRRHYENKTSFRWRFGQSNKVK